MEVSIINEENKENIENEPVFKSPKKKSRLKTKQQQNKSDLSIGDLNSTFSASQNNNSKGDNSFQLLSESILGNVDPTRESIPFTKGNRTNGSPNMPRESLGILHFKSPKGLKNCFSVDDLGRESLGIIQFKSPKGNFGKESLGVLHFTNAHLNPEEIGKESLGILHLKSSPNSIKGLINLSAEDPGRESLGILKLKSPDVTSNPSSLLNEAFLQVPSFRGKILSSGSSVKGSGLSFNSASLAPSELSTISMLSTPENWKSNDFNDAFVLTANSNRVAALSSTSSAASSLVLSPINFNSKYIGGEDDVLAKRLREHKKNIKSVTEEALKLKESAQEQLDKIKRCWSVQKPKKRTRIVRRASCSNVALFDDEEDKNSDNVFNESVFIEAKYIASKISDGSILNSPEDGNILDCTPQPNWEDIDDVEVVKEEKLDTESVFKVVDKMLPPAAAPKEEECKLSLISNDDAVQDELDAQKQTNLETGQGEGQIDVNNSSNKSQNGCPCENTSQLSNNSRDVLQNLSSILMNSQNKTSVSVASSNASQKSAKEILQNLSDILTNENPTPQQRLEGQNLLYSLAHILWSDNSSNYSHDKPTDSLEDSGRSSIENADQINLHEQEPPRCYEILDLRKNSGVPNETSPKVLDLSVKSKISEKKAKKSPEVKPEHPVLVRTSFGSNDSRRSTFSLNRKGLKDVSASSNDSKGNSGNVSQNPARSSVGAKLKPKKLDPNSGPMKKGPMKAVLPIGDMAKRLNMGKMIHLNTTPARSIKPQSSLLLNKRTSTPKVEPEMKPMAQSTPDPTNKSMEAYARSASKIRRIPCPVSPLARNSSTVNTSGANASNHSTNRSGSAPASLNKSGPSSIATLGRRLSTDDMKSNANPPAFKRSYSIGSATAPSAALAKVRSALAAKQTVPTKDNSSSAKPKTSESQLVRSSSFGDRSKNFSPSIKPTNLAAKLKTAKR